MDTSVAIEGFNKVEVLSKVIQVSEKGTVIEILEFGTLVIKGSK